MVTELLRLLGETTLAMMLALVTVLLLRSPLRRLFGARVAYAVWWLVPLATLAMLLPPPVREVSVFTRNTIAAMGIMPLPAAEPAQSISNLYPWLALVWGCGTLFTANSFHHMQLRYRRALGILSSRDDGVFVSQVAGGCPAVVGAWKPKIVLPFDFDRRYPKQEGEMVLAHERAHLRRRDSIANLAAVALRCVYWFNPVLHWAASRFRHDQEMACDAMVLGQFPNRRRSYAEAMLKTQLAVLGLPVGCHWQSSQLLKERIVMLKQPLPGIRRLRIGILCIAVAASIGSYTAWALQPGGMVKAPMKDDTVRDKPVEVKYAPPPKYPVDALADQKNGKVVLLVDVDADGSVTHVQVDRSYPPTEFDVAAVEAAKLWKFFPAIQGGKAIPGRVQIPVTFEASQAKEAGSSAGKQYAWYRQEATDNQWQEMTCDTFVVQQDENNGQVSNMACGIVADSRIAK